MRRHGVERLGAFATVPVDGDGFEPEFPRLDVGLHDLIDGALLRHVDRLRDGTGEERLHRRHHLDVAHVMDGAQTAGGTDGTIEDRQVFLSKVRRAFDGAVFVDVLTISFDFFGSGTRAGRGRREPFD